MQVQLTFQLFRFPLLLLTSQEFNSSVELNHHLLLNQRAKARQETRLEELQLQIPHLLAENETMENQEQKFFRRRV